MYLKLSKIKSIAISCLNFWSVFIPKILSIPFTPKFYEIEKQSLKKQQNIEIYSLLLMRSKPKC